MRRRTLLAALALTTATATGLGCAQAQEVAQEITEGDGGGWTVNWDAVSRCESGGRWDHPPVTNSSGTYSGGLMWNVRYWRSMGGTEFASAPHLATKAQQIEISERAIGGSYATADRMWQCIGGPARSGV